MRLLMVGQSGSAYMKNYIENVVASYGFEEIILTDFGDVPAIYKEIYDRNGVRLEGIYNRFLRLLNRIPKVRILIASKIWAKQLRMKYGSFDLVHVHYLSDYNGEIAINLRDITKKVIISVMGGETLEHTNSYIKRREKYYRIADGITFNSIRCKDRFIDAFGHGFDRLLYYNLFSIELTKQIDEVLMHTSQHELKKKYGCSNKIVIAVGHNGYKGQQHIELSKQIAMLPTEIKERVLLLYSMTYGSRNRMYIDRVHRAAEGTGCQFLFFTKYMSDKERAEITIMSDVLIHAQKTDAFSGSVQEFMYADSIVLNGSWLRYEDIPDFTRRAIEFDSIDELPERIMDIVTNHDSYRMRYKNHDFMKVFLAEDRIRDSWIETIESVCGERRTGDRDIRRRQ